MIRATGRFLVILLVTFLTAFAIYAIVQNDLVALGTNTLSEGGQFGESGGHGSGDFASRGRLHGETPSQGFAEIGFRGYEFVTGRGILPGLAGILRNVGVIVVITLVVVGIQKVYSLICRR